MPKKEHRNANGAGSFRKLPNGGWEYRITLGNDSEGKQIRKSFYGTKQSEAKKKATDAKDRFNKGIPVVKRDANFGVWFRQYMEVYRKPHMNANTYYCRMHTAEKHIVKNFGNKKVNKITQIAVQQFFNGLGSLGQDTQNKIKEMLYGAFEAAMENDLCSKNPVSKIKTEGKETSERVPFTPDELSILLNYAPLYDGGVSVAVMLLTGYRPGEMIGLQWESIDFAHEVIHLYHAAAIGEERKAVIVGSNKKKNHDRNTPIHPVLKNILLSHFLSEYHRLCPDSNEKLPVIEQYLNTPKNNPLCDQFLFGRKPDNLMLHPYSYKKVFKRFMNAVNEVSKKKVRELVPYSCRHTFSTECDKAGISETQMKYLMGHKVQDVTGHYTHPDMDSLKAAIRRINIKSFEDVDDNGQNMEE